MLSLLIAPTMSRIRRVDLMRSAVFLDCTIQPSLIPFPTGQPGQHYELQISESRETGSDTHSSGGRSSDGSMKPATRATLSGWPDHEELIDCFAVLASLIWRRCCNSTCCRHGRGQIAGFRRQVEGSGIATFSHNSSDWVNSIPFTKFHQLHCLCFRKIR